MLEIESSSNRNANKISAAYAFLFLIIKYTETRKVFFICSLTNLSPYFSSDHKGYAIVYQ